MGSWDFNFHGLDSLLQRIAERGSSDSNLSSNQFWAPTLLELKRIQDAESNNSEEIFQALISCLVSAGMAIEHLESRVVELESRLE